MKLERIAYVAVMVICSAVTIPLAAPGQTPEPGDAPFVDGALFVRPPRPALLRQDAAQVAAPELPAMRVELPPTAIPANRLDEIRRRASDLNGDGIVDDADRTLLRKEFGPCPAGERCRNDLNGDGRVDDGDEKLLMEHLGRTCNVGEAQFEEVGYIQPAPANLLPPLPRQARADGSRAVKVELRSADAIGLRVQFKDVQLSGGLQVHVYDPAGTAVLGPHTAPRLAMDGTWWAPTIFRRHDRAGADGARRRGSPAPDADDQLGHVYVLHRPGGVPRRFPTGNGDELSQRRELLARLGR
jgi:hypothetical protein